MAFGACADPGAGNAKRISVLIGEDGTIERVYPKVDPKQHAEQVLRDVAGPT
jgi:peroxiredoxin